MTRNQSHFTNGVHLCAYCKAGLASDTHIAIECSHFAETRKKLDVNGINEAFLKHPNMPDLVKIAKLFLETDLVPNDNTQYH